MMEYIASNDRYAYIFERSVVGAIGADKPSKTQLGLKVEGPGHPKRFPASLRSRLTIHDFQRYLSMLAPFFPVIDWLGTMIYCIDQSLTSGLILLAEREIYRWHHKISLTF